MSELWVKALGGLKVSWRGEEIPALPGQPVRCALLVYLAVERSASRDELASLLWPDSDPERARHALSQTLYELRRQFGDDWILTQADRLVATDQLQSDVFDFEDAVLAGDSDRAFGAYAGPLLNGWMPPSTDGFDRWVDRRRVHLSRQFRELSRRMVDDLTEQDDLAAALAISRRWVDADPLDDEAQHALIRLLIATGRRFDAVRQFQEYEELVTTELDVEPLEETRQLIDGLREMGVARPAIPESPQLGAVRPALKNGENVKPQVASVRLATRVRPFAGLLSIGLVVVIGLSWWLTRPDASQPEQPKSIAVLPFLNLSADPEQEYFSDGITEDILASLARIEGLRVISRTSVWRYKGATPSLSTVAAELGVEYILEGSVRRDGEQVRITAQLIHAPTDAHLWAESYDRELSGIFHIKSEIAEQIAASMQQRLVPGTGSAADLRPTDPVAYDLYLRGREYLNRPSDADLQKFAPAMAFFQRAIERDPEFARAYVGVAETYRRNVVLSEIVRSDSAARYARRALVINPSLTEATTSLGLAAVLRGDVDSARALFEEALLQDPNHADAMSGLAFAEALSGRLGEAVRWERRAVSVDPFSAPRLTTLGGYLFDVGDLDGARHAFEQALEVAPDHPEPAFLLAQILLIEGDEQRADDLMASLPSASSNHPVAHLLLGRYATQRGRFDRAKEHFDQSPQIGAVTVFDALRLQGVGREGEAHASLVRALGMLRQAEEAGFRVPPRPLLYVPAMLGDADAALDAIESHWRSGLRSGAGDPPEIGIYYLDAEPMMYRLRDDTRFVEVMDQIRTELDEIRVAVSGDR